MYKKVSELSITPYALQKDAKCVLVEYIIEGTQLSENRPNDVFVYDSHHLQCLHSSRPLVFGIHYSERYLKQVKRGQW